MEESRVGAEMAQSDAAQAHVDADLMRAYWVHNLELACLQAIGVSTQSNLVSYSGEMDFTAVLSKLEEHRQHWIHQPVDAEHKRDAALLDAGFADVGLKALEGLYEEALGICQGLLDNEIFMLGASPFWLKSRVEGVKGLVHALKGEWEAAHGFLLRSIMQGLKQICTSGGTSDFFYDYVVGTFAEALGYLLTHVVETDGTTRDSSLQESIATPRHCYHSHALYPILLLGLGALGGEGSNFQVPPLNVERLRLDCARQFSRGLGATSPVCSSAYDKAALVLKQANNKDYELMIMAQSFQLAESIHLAQSVGETHSENDPLLEPGSSDLGSKHRYDPLIQSLKIYSRALRLKLSMCTEIETDSEILSFCQRISEAIALVIAQASLDAGKFKRPADAQPVDVIIHSLCFIAYLERDDDRRLEALEEVAAAMSKGGPVQEASWINASLQELADIYIRRGAYKKAAHIYNLHANMATDIKFKLLLRSNQAGNLYQAGELENAIKVIEDAVMNASIHLNKSEWKLRAMIHISAASFFDKSGQTDRAIAAREEAHRDIRDHAMSYKFINEMDWQLVEGMIKLLQNYAAQSNWSGAYKLMDSIDAHVDRDFHNQPIWIAWNNNKYSVAIANGDYESALDILDNCPIMDENTSIQNLTLYKLDKMAATANHHETRGKWKKAIQETDQMLELINNLPHSMDPRKNHKNEIMVRLHRSHYYSQCKDPASAHEELEKALTMINSIEDQDVPADVRLALVHILCFKAVDARRNGDFVESERLMSLAKSKVPECNNAMELAEVEFGQAKLLSHKEKWVEAADKARAAALLAMDEQRRRYHLDRGPTSWLFFSTEIGLNEKLWFMEELYTFCLGDVMTGLVWAERSQMRFLLHQVHSQPEETAIPNPSHLDECDTLLSSLIFQTVRALPTKTAIIEYSYNPNRELIYMYVMERTPDGEDASVRCKRCHLPTWFKLACLPSNKSLQELTEDAIDEHDPSIEALTILHALLIQFIEDDLKGCDSLIFVPGHGYLATIPYAALYDDRHKQHLIARYNVAVVPSIVTLHRCLYSQYNFEMNLQLSGPSLLQDQALFEPGASRVSRQSLTIFDPGKSAPYRVDPWIVDGHLSSKVAFIAGNPVPMGLGLGQLSGAEEEAKAVAEFFKVTPCMGRDMTKQAVLDGLSTSKVVLLATHGMVHETDYPHGCLVLQASPLPDEIASTMLPPEVDMLGLSKQLSDVALASMASTSKVSSTAIPIVDLKGKGIAQEEERVTPQHGGMRNWRHSEFTDMRSKQKRAKEAPQILTAEEIVALEGGISAGLVVLSACQSGLGKATVGEGVLGLGRALLQAGAVSTILTLWDVNDAFSKRFITDLFKELLTFEPRGRSVSECLKKVMVRMILEGQPLKNWAAFTIVGSPALRLSKVDNNWGVSGLDKNSYLLFASEKTCPYPCRVCEEKIKIHKESLTVYNIISGDDTNAEDQPKELDELMRRGARLERIGNTNAFILKMQDGSYNIT